MTAQLKKETAWKKGRGKLGIFQPLLGNWKAEADSPKGTFTCTRTFKTILGGKYVELTVKWDFGNTVYEELAVFGITGDGLAFRSFTSDGKQSEGYLAAADDVHPQAVCFQANMPAGLARMIYWPGESGSFYWAVESKTKTGWNRFTEHHYHPLP